MTIDLDEVIAGHGDDDPARYLAIADHFLQLGDRPAAAVALDRAYGLRPDDADLARQRAAILDELAVTEHGIAWRYIPAGTFVMGSASGDPDERPVHPRRVEAFWIADTPLSWAQYCAFAGCGPPPDGQPFDVETVPRDRQFTLYESYKIRRQYCEDDVGGAGDWHLHAGMLGGRTDATGRYETKAVVAVAPIEAEELAGRRSTTAITYALPTEAQWEKAARGGLAGRRYPWGDALPTRATCDFDRMGDFRLVPPRTLPANGYGVHGMCGGVSEWTADIYDALAYRAAVDVPRAEPDEDGVQRVLRGGSWTDCAEAVTVSYRMSRPPDRSLTPTVGVRLVRVAR